MVEGKEKTETVPPSELPEEVPSREEYKELLKGSVDEVKRALENISSPDYDTILELEKENKDRKTLKNWLKGQVEKVPPSERKTSFAFENLSEDSSLAELQENLTEREAKGVSADFNKYTDYTLPDHVEEEERYWIEKPYSWVSISYDPEENERMYHLVEPTLTRGEEKALQLLNKNLKDQLSYGEESKNRERVLRETTEELLSKYGISLDKNSMDKLMYYLKRNFLGYGKIDALLKDPHIEDVSCDGLDVPIFLYHREYQGLRTNLIFRDENELDLYVIQLAEKAGKQITMGNPTIDASLPEGYRLQLTLGAEVTTRGSSFSIRKYSEEPFTPTHLINYGTFSPEMLAYLWLAIENKQSIIVVGGTASGKTSTLNALSLFIQPDAKIVSIEDTREISLYHENWVPNTTREAPGERGVDMYQLVRQGLRQRPEVMIVGEVRGKEALSLFQAMNTGHTVYSTLHAGSIKETIHRLEGEPINVPHHMISALDIVCLQLLTNYKDERVRRNQQTIEIQGIDSATGALRTNRIYERNPLNDDFEKVSEPTVLRDIAEERGWSTIRIEKELRNREKILRYMADNDITRLQEVARIIRQYYHDPDKVLNQIESEGEIQEPLVEESEEGELTANGGGVNASEDSEESSNFPKA